MHTQGKHAGLQDMVQPVQASMTHEIDVMGCHTWLLS